MNMYYHGTSYDNYLSIINQNNNYNTNWEQSDTSMIYLWDENNKRNKLKCIKESYFSAKYCSAIHDSQYNKLIIFEFNIDENNVYDDNTDEDCRYDPRKCITKELFNQLIINKQYNVIELPYYPEHRYKYLYPLWLYNDINKKLLTSEDEKIFISMEKEILKCNGGRCSEYYFTDETGFRDEWINK